MGLYCDRQREASSAVYMYAYLLLPSKMRVCTHASVTVESVQTVDCRLELYLHTELLHLLQPILRHFLSTPKSNNLHVDELFVTCTYCSDHELQLVKWIQTHDRAQGQVLS